MQILEQTHNFLETLGAKVMLQKMEGKKEEPDAEEAENKAEAAEEEAAKAEKDEDSEEKDMDDNAKVKENLKNSSRIYYDITHSVKENITT